MQVNSKFIQGESMEGFRSSYLSLTRSMMASVRPSCSRVRFSFPGPAKSNLNASYEIFETVLKLLQFHYLFQIQSSLRAN